MKQENPYVISEFKNPSGKIVFQIYARIDGKRFRKNFPTRAEAEAERQILGIQYLQETEMRVAATRLGPPASGAGRAVAKRRRDRRVEARRPYQGPHTSLISPFKAKLCGIGAWQPTRG